MKSSSKIKRIIASLALAAIFGSFSAGYASAQDSSMILSITPPLFKVNMKPGEVWSSVVKVVNNNAYPVTVYTQVADFKSGESGGVEFVKNEPDAAGKGYTLSQWLEITSEPIDIGAFSSQDIPFKVMLPQTADPGGHYAAILVGNKPIDNTAGSVVKISSKLASLLLVRVAGEVVEKGDVREFSTSKGFSKKTEADFTVRFINKGNVHLRPEGEVKITNMFGQTRGVIAINKKSEFGNVLPDSEKKWEFNWKGESSIWDAGRMKAELFLSYGEEGKQSEVRKINFWVVNLKPTLAVAGSLLFIVMMTIFLIRRFIRKSIGKARMEAEAVAGRLGRTLPQTEARSLPTAKTPAGKMDGVVVNLRDANTNNLNNKTTKPMNWSFLKNVLIFIVVALIVVAAAFFYSQYKKSSTKTAEDNAPKSAGVTVVNNENATSAPAVEAIDETASTTATSTDSIATSTEAVATSTDSVATSTAATSTETLPKALDKKEVKLSILNGSGVTGVSSKAAKILEEAGYIVASKGNAANFNFAVTEISYSSDVTDNAEAIDQLVGGDSKMTEDPATSGKIVVTLGKNFQ
ncbi:DUF916 domain-containing protein [Candidatus Falkowbacteria bacterium]|nr:DUF916 domain-containing protein [Candidatus Falkowbacteria bacterium]